MPNQISFNCLPIFMSCPADERNGKDGKNGQPHRGFISSFMLSSLAAAMLFSGCMSSITPLAANHPANPDASEGGGAQAHPSLRPDALTRRSRALISAAEKEQEETNKNEPVPATPANGNAPATPGAMPGMNHEQMKGMGQ